MFYILHKNNYASVTKAKSRRDCTVPNITFKASKKEKSSEEIKRK